MGDNISNLNLKNFRIEFNDDVDRVATHDSAICAYPANGRDTNGEG